MYRYYSTNFQELSFATTAAWRSSAPLRFDFQDYM